VKNIKSEAFAKTGGGDRILKKKKKKQKYGDQK
jgi:hypothetical protein